MRLRLPAILASILCALLLVTPSYAQRQVTIGVLGLFHPRELILQPAAMQAISVRYASQTLLLNGERGHRALVLRAAGNNVAIAGLLMPRIEVSARDGSPARFRLEAPGKIHRNYAGKLSITAENGRLIAVIALDIEEAVAAIVASEMPQTAPMEALKAQAVAVRSFLSAGSRHPNFDFCDTTHCQFFRSPEDADERVREAVAATQGIVLSWNQRIIAAMYASRCGGHTHTLRETGMKSGDAYPYYSVLCRWCHEHPLRWRRKIIGGDQTIPSENEPARIRYARQWGWGSLPGNQFTTTKDANGEWMEGRNIGHGIGLCQAGAMGMASAGQDFRSILTHYYPNSVIDRLP
ncbi:MAG TPA: SpoIID/LytB domain-containing protein [Acidobacteriaceae bacterium]|nr:SpoIID/LytB domain-containing protein [Acidobacteriaceae bacterium]